jgi:hypothetical protein
VIAIACWPLADLTGAAANVCFCPVADMATIRSDVRFQGAKRTWSRAGVDVGLRPEADAAALISQVLRQRRAGPQFAATALSYRMMCHADGVRESFTCSTGHPTRAVRSRPC